MKMESAQILMRGTIYVFAYKVGERQIYHINKKALKFQVGDK